MKSLMGRDLRMCILLLSIVYTYIVTWLSLNLLDIRINRWIHGIIFFAQGIAVYAAASLAGPQSTVPLCISLGATYTAVIIYAKHLQINVKRELMQNLENEQLEVQASAIEAMREQRHDILNELAIISSYVQMGMPGKAKEALDFLAAKLADKYNYSELPKDAWLSMINQKQQLAALLDIELTICLEADSPSDFNEQRLLPKAVALLLDNAFDAVSREPHPKVELIWKQVGHCRILSVENNGPLIPADELDRLFEYGYSSKPGPNRGWGLPLCRCIAAELGGGLSVRSSPYSTKFIFMLVGKGQEAFAEVAAARDGVEEWQSPVGSTNR